MKIVFTEISFLDHKPITFYYSHINCIDIYFNRIICSNTKFKFNQSF